ncbi:PQQ-dependent sugar dehydrogenase [Radiobacillus sp. PE A8.2]|uniref:PQQ-dependent sugar dehydrogenase n=1 Tax=Radiobacillus sp. PE A8.2 TaxID=3380349 RepID=UPI003890E133
MKKIRIFRGGFLKKSSFLTILGIISLVAVVWFVNTTGEHNAEDETDQSNDEQQDTYNKEAVQVGADSIEVVTGDGNIAVNHLFIPWTINKHEQTFYLSQREGSVIEIDGDFGLVHVQEVDVTENIQHEGEGGFLGFTLAPDFEQTKKAFAYHTYEKDGEIQNRIISLKLQDNAWVEEEVLLDNIPGNVIHNGGRLKIGPDGMLYASTGDTGQGELAQDLDSLAGKILRMNLNGNIPEDNPFENSYVYSYGHRNPQGFAWNNNGDFYSSEHGESAHDEINLIKAGENYGWPVIEGDETATNMVSPVYQSGDDTWAPSGMAYHDGQLFIASLAGSKIITYDIEKKEVEEFYGDAGRLRDVLIDNEDIFTITSNQDDRGEPGKKDDRLIQIPLTEKVSN